MDDAERELGLHPMQKVSMSNDMDEAEAMELALEAQHHARRSSPAPPLAVLIGSAKPPFIAEGFTRVEGPGSERRFKAVFDGREAWVIERPDRAEVTTPGRTILADNSEVEVIDGMVSVNNDVKVMLDGRRSVYLDSASFEDLGEETVGERRCVHVRARGLKGPDNDAEFDMYVDGETGVVLRAIREPGEVLFEVTSFRVGRPEEA